MTTSRTELTIGIGIWMLCSVGMVVFNKMAIMAFPAECSLVVLQMLTAVILVPLFCWSAIRAGSRKDVLRWCMVVPFFAGMLLTSILALKHAPMSLTITFRGLSPIIALSFERCYPNPVKVNAQMLAAMFGMIVGVLLYASALEKQEWNGVFWIFLNNFFAIGDRLLQRLMLAENQRPVDISKTGVTLINNLLGMVPLMVVALLQGEMKQIPHMASELNGLGMFWVASSCLVGVAISYSGIWVQSLITATSFLVLVNANKFVIIFLEVFVVHSKQMLPRQIMGACVVILAGIGYGKARQIVEQENEAEERQALLANGKPTAGRV